MGNVISPFICIQSIINLHAFHFSNIHENCTHQFRENDINTGYTVYFTSYFINIFAMNNKLCRNGHQMILVLTNWFFGHLLK